MADSLSNRSPESSASQSTRQLLDELDELMQRMLALPVQAPDKEEPKPPGIRRDPPAQAAEQFPAPLNTLTIQAPVVAAAQEVAVSQVGPTWPQVVAPAPALPILTPPEMSEPMLSAPTYLPVGAEPLLPIILQRPSARKERTPATNPPGAPELLPPPRPVWLKVPAAPRLPGPVAEGKWSVRLLVGINRSFDRCTAWLGSVGRWLRGELGRAALGWAGVAMLIVALVWAAMRFLI
jgi:hypothetical protein